MKKYFLLILSASTVIIILALLFSMRTRKQSMKTEAGNSDTAACNTGDLSGAFDYGSMTAFFEGKEVDIPQVAVDTSLGNVLGTTSQERWIEVDLSEQKLKAWEGNSLFLETPVSTGLSFTPTPVGEYRIWIKLRATKMSGGTGRNYYYLPNVPYVMYFHKGYGLHGTYWHNDFGRPRSHGCVNLPTPIAQQLFYWVGPILPEGKSSVKSTAENLGTRIVVHE